MKLTRLTTTLVATTMATATVAHAAPLPNNTNNNNAVGARSAGPVPASTPMQTPSSTLPSTPDKDKENAIDVEGVGVDIRDTGSDPPSPEKLSDREYEELVARELAKRARAFICVIL